MYLCNIADNDGRPEFRVSFHEDNFADITFAEFSASGRNFLMVSDSWRFLILYF